MSATMLPLYVAIAVASISSTDAFTPLTRTADLSTSIARTIQPNQHQHQKIPTALGISWPGQGQDDKNEAEGKRDQDSRLNLSGDTSEASLFLDGISSKSIEDFVAPVSKVLDDQTGGWALSYANLEPETETSPIGLSFLATNVAYGMAGYLITSQGNPVLGALTELACIASFFYHWSQLKYGQQGSRVVRLALLVDYAFAITAILVGSGQLLLSHQLPTEALTAGVLAVASLGACWVWEEGLTYIFFHSLWHLFSAYTGYIIGTTH